MLKVSDTNDSAESSKKAGFNCSYGHKSLLDFSEASAQFAPNEILTQKSYILKFTLYYQVGSFFIVFWLFLLKNPLTILFSVILIFRFINT